VQIDGLKIQPVAAQAGGFSLEPTGSVTVPAPPKSMAWRQNVPRACARAARSIRYIRGVLPDVPRFADLDRLRIDASIVHPSQDGVGVRGVLAE